ncbi:MAG TPA: chemotaxis protein CheW [Thermoanaerobaculia bacterium]|nr:chemotaxis protein CheW [Thermoanaerobaculia bacterium]
MWREAKSAAQGETPKGGRQTGNHLLVRSGELVCALPLGAVRRVVRALPVHPLPGAGPALRGLAEFAGEPLPVLDLSRLVGAPPGAQSSYPVTVVVWAGPVDARETVGLAADAALAVAEVSPGALVGGDGALVRGEAAIGGQVVRVLDLEALGRDR